MSLTKVTKDRNYGQISDGNGDASGERSTQHFGFVTKVRILEVFIVVAVVLAFDQQLIKSFQLRLFHILIDIFTFRLTISSTTFLFLNV